MEKVLTNLGLGVGTISNSTCHLVCCMLLMIFVEDNWTCAFLCYLCIKECSVLVLLQLSGMEEQTIDHFNESTGF